MSIYQRLRIWNRATRYLRKSEPAECQFALACLRAGMNAVDIGAHKAAYTYWMSQKVGRKGQVLAFEPVPVLARYLQRYALSCRYGNVRVCQIALSDSTGETRLRIPGNDYCWSTLNYESSEVADPQAGCSYVPVRTNTLDSQLEIMNARHPIGFIKCDVEGHELAVLRGSQRTLQRDRPLLLFESALLTDSPATANPAFPFLSDLGYQGFFFFQDELIALEEHRADRYPNGVANVQNFAFIHPDCWTLRNARRPFKVDRCHSAPRGRKAA